MNKKVVYIALLSCALTVSLLSNMNQYSKVSELEQTIQKLSEQDEATNRAKEFVKLLMELGLDKGNEKKIRSITTDQAQNMIFNQPESDEPEEKLEEGIEQQVVLDNSYFNRKSLDEVSVIIKYRVNFKVDHKVTSSEYEMKVNLIRLDDVWKVDHFQLESAGSPSPDKGEEKK